MTTTNAIRVPFSYRPLDVQLYPVRYSTDTGFDGFVKQIGEFERELNGRVLVFAGCQASNAIILAKPGDSVWPQIPQYRAFHAVGATGNCFSPIIKDGASLYVSPPYALAHDYKALVGVITGACGVLIAEFRDNRFDGWAFVFADIVGALENYIDGYKKCVEGGPNRLEIVQLCGVPRQLEAQLTLVKIPYSVTYIPLDMSDATIFVRLGFPHHFMPAPRRYERRPRP